VQHGPGLRRAGEEHDGPERGEVRERLLRARLHGAVPRCRGPAGAGADGVGELVRGLQQRGPLGQRVREGRGVAAWRGAGAVRAALRGLPVPLGLGEGAVEQRGSRAGHHLSVEEPGRRVEREQDHLLRRRRSAVLPKEQGRTRERSANGAVRRLPLSHLERRPLLRDRTKVLNSSIRSLGTIPNLRWTIFPQKCMHAFLC